MGHPQQHLGCSCLVPRGTVLLLSYPDEREAVQSLVVGLLFLPLASPSHSDSCIKDIMYMLKQQACQLEGVTEKHKHRQSSITEL